MKYSINILLLLSTLFFTACSQNQRQISEIKDLMTLPQTAANYTHNIPVVSSELQKELDNKFNELYFKPWDLKSMSYSVEDASWGKMYAKKKMYAENHKLIAKEWFDRQIYNSNFDKYNTVLKNAITTNNSNLRVYPTKNAMFYNPKKPGEGFPFDYNQNSSLKINTPLFISHFSKDRAWVFVETNFAIGWVSTKDIAFIDDILIKKFKSGTYFVATQDNFPMYKNDIFIEYIKMGTIFPLRKNKYVTINKGANLQGYLSYVRIPDEYIQQKPLKFSRDNINKIADSIIKEPYGWGGVMNHRDCSAMTKDFFTPFGIYLKRNSAGQIKRGKYIELKDLTLEEKKRQIVQQGLPFLTLVYLKGHIMLYIGERDGEPLVFHNVWGVKTLENDGEYGRFIIGRAVITTLEPGRELPNYVEEKNILSKIEGIVILNQNTPSDGQTLN